MASHNQLGFEKRIFIVQEILHRQAGIASRKAIFDSPLVACQVHMSKAVLLRDFLTINLM